MRERFWPGVVDSAPSVTINGSKCLAPYPPPHPPTFEQCPMASKGIKNQKTRRGSLPAVTKSTDQASIRVRVSDSGFVTRVAVRSSDSDRVQRSVATSLLVSTRRDTIARSNLSRQIVFRQIVFRRWPLAMSRPGTTRLAS